MASNQVMAASSGLADRLAEPPGPIRGPIRTVYLCAALLLLTVAAYSSVQENGFVDCDDEVYIVKNPDVLAGFTLEGFFWAWDNVQAPYWHPLTWLSLQFDAHFFSTRTDSGKLVPSPAAFHAQSLFWHAAAVLALFGLWNKLTGARWSSFFVAALFAVHPLRVESVAFAAERKDVLSVFFGILSIWAYACYVETRRPRWYVAMMAAYLMSLMAKPMLITLPFVLLLLDYWPLCRLRTSPAEDLPARPGFKRLRFEQAVVEKFPLFALALASGVVTILCRLRFGSVVSLGTISLDDRLANCLAAYGWYLFSTFCPLWLSGMYPHAYGHWSPWRVLAGGGALLAISAVCLWQARRRPWLLVGWLWFVGTIFPVTGLVQGGPQAWADRFTYWPHIGLLVALVWAARELFQRLRAPWLVPATVGAVLVVVLAVLTWFQVATWRDPLTLWEHAVAVDWDNDWAHQRLGQLYSQQGRPDKSRFHLAVAQQIQRKRLFGR